MGNYISCTISHSAYKNCKGTKVILPTGELRQFDFPIQAAEMMFETPNFFLVNTKSLKIGGRFCALKAETDLEVCQVYAMFPMKRLNTVVTAADMGKLLVTANNTRKRARVTPEFATMKVVAKPESPRRTESTTPEPGTPRKVKPTPEPEEIARKLKPEPEKPCKAPRKVKPAPEPEEIARKLKPATEPEKPRKAPRKVKPAPEPEEIARKLKLAPEPEKPRKASRKVKPVQAPPPPPPAALLIPEYEEEPEQAPGPSPEPEQDPESEFEPLPTLNPCEMEIEDIDFSITELKNRLLMCRKKPTLETILEDQPVH